MEVNLIDYMGDDIRVVNAARVSFDKESDWEYFNADGYPVINTQNWETYNYTFQQLSDKDIGLLKYLAKHNHWTPFSHVMITMREKVPIFVARQRFKHMVGFTYNEVSRRYVDNDPEFFIPDVWRKRAENKKQGSSEDEVVETLVVSESGWDENSLDKGKELDLNEQYQKTLSYLSWWYHELIKAGVAPEQARMVLPQSMYTEYYVTGSLAAWARAYKLRIDSHAQKEIQILAQRWGEIIEGIDELKNSWEALSK